LFKKYQKVEYTPSLEWFKKKIKFENMEDDLREESINFFEAAAPLIKPSYSIMFGNIENFVLHNEGTPEESGEMDFMNHHYTGKMLKALNGVSTVVAYIITCGMGVEDFDSSSYDEFFIEYWKDILKTRAMSAAQRECNKFVKDFLDVESLSSVAPGTGEMQLWSITELSTLFNTITDHVESDAHMVRDAYMLPNKTICGLMFSSNKPYFSCSECKREHCQDRKVPFGYTKPNHK
jgi:hypothetical protein